MATRQSCALSWGGVVNHATFRFGYCVELQIIDGLSGRKLGTGLPEALGLRRSKIAWNVTCRACVTAAPNQAEAWPLREARSGVETLFAKF